MLSLPTLDRKPYMLFFSLGLSRAARLGLSAMLDQSENPETLARLGRGLLVAHAGGSEHVGDPSWAPPPPPSWPPQRVLGGNGKIMPLTLQRLTMDLWQPAHVDTSLWPLSQAISGCCHTHTHTYTVSWFGFPKEEKKAGSRAIVLFCSRTVVGLILPAGCSKTEYGDAFLSQADRRVPLDMYRVQKRFMMPDQTERKTFQVGRGDPQLDDVATTTINV